MRRLSEGRFLSRNTTRMDMRVAASTQTSPLCLELLSFPYWDVDITPQCKSRNKIQTPLNYGSDMRSSP